MKSKKGKSNMLIPTVIMGIIAVTLLIIGYQKGDGQHIVGLKIGSKMLYEIIPLLFFAFVIAGMAQILIPKEQLAGWVGDEAGFKGIMIGTIAGGLTPGGPFVSLPVVAGLLKSGASIGTVVAYLTGWSLLAVGRLPLDIGILGWKFTCVRIACTFFFPPIAGYLAQTFFTSVR